MPPSYKNLVDAADKVVPRISAQDLMELQKRTDVLIVDVRDGTEVLASGKVAGALHVARGSLESRIDPTSGNFNPGFDPARTIVTYCAGGGRAALAGKTLVDMGYPKVMNLGGFRDWVSAGGAVDK
jgi:rhodanese-related sulfurtransferase